MVVNTFTGVSSKKNLLEPSISGRFFLNLQYSSKGKTKKVSLFFNDPQMHDKNNKIDSNTM